MGASYGAKMTLHVHDDLPGLGEAWMQGCKTDQPARKIAQIGIGIKIGNNLFAKLKPR